MKTHALIIKIGAKKPKNIRNCESAASLGDVILAKASRTDLRCSRSFLRVCSDCEASGLAEIWQNHGWQESAGFEPISAQTRFRPLRTPCVVGN